MRVARVFHICFDNIFLTPPRVRVIKLPTLNAAKTNPGRPPGAFNLCVIYMISDFYYVEHTIHRQNTEIEQHRGARCVHEVFMQITRNFPDDSAQISRDQPSRGYAACCIIGRAMRRCCVKLRGNFIRRLLLEVFNCGLLIILNICVVSFLNGRNGFIDYLEYNQ